MQRNVMGAGRAAAQVRTSEQAGVDQTGDARHLVVVGGCWWCAAWPGDPQNSSAKIRRAKGTSRTVVDSDSDVQNRCLRAAGEGRCISIMYTQYERVE